MAAVAAGEAAVDHVFEDIMGFCLQCRACEAVCPSLVPFGRAMEGARAEVAAQRPTIKRRLRHRLLGRGLASRRLIRLGTAAIAVAQRLRIHRLPGPGRKLVGLRKLSVRPPSTLGGEWVPDGTTDRGTAALLAGCVMDPWFASVHEATIEVLRAGGYRVVVPETQTCCGALAAHDGAAAEAKRLAEINLDAFGDAGVVVVDAAGCGAHLRDYEHWVAGGEILGSRVRDVTEVVAELLADGALPTSSIDRGPVAIQDPCHLRHAQRIVDAPRAVLRAAGHQPVEIDEDALCCGAAGIYTLLHADASAELGRRKAEQVRVTGVSIVASANPGCEMQLRTYLGSDYRIAHPVELYWESIAAKL